YTSQQVDKNCALEIENEDENSKTLLAKSYNIPGSSDESDGFDSSDSNYDSNKLDSQDIENINPSLIQNSIVHARKDALRKTRFKRLYKVKQKNAEHQKTKE
ncbi:10060_t:CDS:2, partial [Racocetra persica]